MKYFFLIVAVLLSTSCNIYSSEPRDFINDNGSFNEDKIVVSSNKVIHTSYCLLHLLPEQEGLPPIIAQGSIQELNYSIYQESDKAVVLLTTPEDDITCNYNLKNSSLNSSQTDLILNLSLEALKNSKD